MTTCSRLARIIGLAAACAVLAACSTVKLAYNNVDTVAYWWLHGYVEFSDTQAPLVRADIAKLHQWHRANELPRYVQLLRRIEQLAPEPVTAGQVCGFVDVLLERANAVADQAEPAVVAAALGMGPDQLQALERKYRDNNDDYRKDWLALKPAEQKDKRFKQILDRSEMVYGRLGEVQRTVLRQQLDASVFDPRRLLAERERRQQDLLQTLRKLQGPGVTPGQARTVMRAYLDRAQASTDPGYRAYQDELIQEGCRTLAATHNATTPEQRATAVERLRGYQRDLSELSAQR